MTSHLAVHFRYVRGLAIVLSVVVALLSASSWLEAHDFWLVPGAFPFADGADVEVLGQTGTKFPASTSAVPANRVARAVMIGAEGESVISDLSVRGTSLVLRSRPTSPGQRIVAADLAARSTRQLPTAFLAYLRLEGAPDAAARIERDGLLKATDSLTRTDVKYAKTLVDVGTRGPRAYGRMSGQVLEFVPQQDAATLATGDTLRLRVLFRGKPLAGVVAAAGRAPRDSAEKVEPDVHLTTDAEGVVRLPITTTGLWNVRAIHVLQASPGAWETHWATFVVRIGT